MTESRYAEIARTKKACEFCPDLGNGEACMTCQRVQPIAAAELHEFWHRVCMGQVDAKDTTPNPQSNFEYMRAQTDTPRAMAVHLMTLDDEFCPGSAQCDAMAESSEDIPDARCIACLERWLGEPHLPLEGANP